MLWVLHHLIKVSLYFPLLLVLFLSEYLLVAGGPLAGSNDLCRCWAAFGDQVHWLFEVASLANEFVNWLG